MARRTRIEEAMSEGEVESRAQRAASTLAAAWQSGRGVEAAIAAAAAADAAKAAEEAAADRRRCSLIPDHIARADTLCHEQSRNSVSHTIAPCVRIQFVLKSKSMSQLL
jgi:succinyl-CoA synthetase alpha subunit